jgi:hypothetical protein
MNYSIGLLFQIVRKLPLSHYFVQTKDTIRTDDDDDDDDDEE